MPTNSLTNLRNKIKILTQLLDTPRWFGPVGLIVAIIINQVLIEFGVWPVQVIWLYLPVVVAAMIGLWPGLISAGMVSAYSIWLQPYDFQRVVVIPLSLLALSLIVGFRTRALRLALAQADAERSWAVALNKKLEIALEEARAGSEAVKALNSLNGNIQRIKQAKANVEQVIALDLLTEGTRDKLGSVVHTLNNLLFATEGWVQLEEIKARQAKPGEDSPVE